MAEDKDISKKTVLVLLLLTLLVSILGTWTILARPNTVYRAVEINPSSSGRVSVHIESPGQPIVTQNSGGMISVNIVDPMEA